METNTLINLKKQNPIVLISRDKTKYIILEEKQQSIQVVSNFEIKDGMIQPSLSIDMNRILRTHSLLKFLPGLITMSSDGLTIDIDSICEIFKFKQDADIVGVIQYHILNRNLKNIKNPIIFEEVFSTPMYKMCTDETSFHSNSLKIFPILLDVGSIICIVDAVEKVLHCPIIDPTTGYVGVSHPTNYNKLLKLSSIWPELNFEYITKDKMIYGFSKILKEASMDENGVITNPCIIKVHRNYGNDELEMKISHLLIENEMVMI